MTVLCANPNLARQEWLSRYGEPAMNARELIDSASFGPDALKVSGRAFDEAWANIAGSFHDPLTVQATRLKLANAILAAGKANGPDDVGLSRGKGPTRAAALRNS